MARKTDTAWEKIFEVKKFDTSKNIHFITAKEIGEIAGEARIIAKFDHSKHLPPILKNNGYFILPVKNGKYAIVRGNGFHELEEQIEVTEVKSKLTFQIQTAGRGSSEMQYLDYAYYSGAIEELLKSGALYQSIRGREFSKQFSFRVENITLDVSSVQIEVDSGLEGEKDLILMEAKIGKPEDFIIRQLFYPYKNYLTHNLNKKITPIFFTFEPDTSLYNFWVYSFTDNDDYNSIQLENQFRIRIKPISEIGLKEISDENIKEKVIIPPQADDFGKVIELIFKVQEGVNHYQTVAEHFGFTERQSSYYRQAAEALGLVGSKNGKYYLTDIGKHFTKLSTVDRSIFISNHLRKFTLIKKALEILNQNGQLTREDLEKIVAENSSLSGSTIPRRAQTLYSWLSWVGEHTNAFKHSNNGFIIN